MDGRGWGASEVSRLVEDWGGRSGGRLRVKAQCEGRHVSVGINVKDRLLRNTSLTSRT